MAKPFKSEFDLMAEAYGTVNHDNQDIINEDTAAKSVRGYFPTAKRALVIKEANMFGDYEDVSSDEPTEELTDEPTDDNTDGEGTVTVQLELDKDTAVKLHTDLMDEVEGEVTSEEPVEGDVADEEPVEGEVASEDAESFDKEPIEMIESHIAKANLNISMAGEIAADAASPAVNKRAGELGANIQKQINNFMDNFGPEEDAEGDAFDRLEGLYNTDLMKTFINTSNELVKDIKNEEPFETEDIHKFLAHKMSEFKSEDGEAAEAVVDYGPSGEGKPVHPDESNESDMNSRLDGMVDQNLLRVAQGAIYNVLKDLHADGEEFELNDVANFIATSLPSEDNQ